jgi:cell division septation protein DedD
VNTRYDSDLDEPGVQDREISLGATTILGIFFALALLCAVFFGFGYTMGRRSALPAASTAEVTIGRESNNAKPSPESLANQTPAEKPAAGTTQSAVLPLDPSNTAAQDSPQVPRPVKTAVPNPRSDVPVEATPRQASKPAAIVTVAATVPTPGSSVVQVAAMSHQEDADVVALDLKRRGYAVAVRHEPQDKFFHVQIGPFPTKKEADVMRQRLQSDGYNNAIVK